MNWDVWGPPLVVVGVGAVIDVEFPRAQMPHIYAALKMEGTALTLEVQQQLGDGVVRTIALGASDGLRRGMLVERQLPLDVHALIATAFAAFPAGHGPPWPRPTR